MVCQTWDYYMYGSLRPNWSLHKLPLVRQFLLDCVINGQEPVPGYGTILSVGRWLTLFSHNKQCRLPGHKLTWQHDSTSNGSWCMGIKGEMSGTVCVTFTWDMYIYIWVVYSLCFFCCLFITVTWWYVWCFEWASGNQEEVQACLVTLWLFIISCYSLYKTTLGLLCSWFENNPYFHKYSMDFHV